MQNLLNQFKALTNDEKIAFMKEAMAEMAESFLKRTPRIGLKFSRKPSKLKYLFTRRQREI